MALQEITLGVQTTPRAGRAPAGGAPREHEAPTAFERRLVSFLGWFSVGLGLAEVLVPGRLARLIGVRERPLLFRALGLRELASGLAIIGRPRAAGPLWSRVVGDAADLSLLAAASRDPENERGRLARATAAVLGVTALDVLAARRLSQGDRGPGAVRVVRSVAINRTPSECYAFWRALERLPEFMVHLEAVRELGERRSRWVARGPAGTRVQWDAELVRDEPGSLIAWRSVAGDVDTAGTVRFLTRPGGGTIVHVDLEYRPPAGQAGAVLRKLFLERPEVQVKDDLHRFKQLIEAGEVPTTEGQPHGRRSLRYRALARLVGGAGAPPGRVRGAGAPLGRVDGGEA